MRTFDLRLGAVCLLVSSALFAAAPEARTVPGRGAGFTHETFSGRVVTLKGAASIEGAHVQATWDFGDGSPARSFAVTRRHDVAATHAYYGAAGTVYQARLTLTDTSTGETSEAAYLVSLREKSLEVETAVAVDEALWWLHKAIHADPAQRTAWSLLAFESQGYRLTGDSRNPYTETVALAWNRVRQTPPEQRDGIFYEAMAASGEASVAPLMAPAARKPDTASARQDLPGRLRALAQSGGATASQWAELESQLRDQNNFDLPMASLYDLAQAFRQHTLDGEPAPVQSIRSERLGPIDWLRAETARGASTDGVARVLLARQSADGSFSEGPAATAMMVTLLAGPVNSVVNVTSQFTITGGSFTFNRFTQRYSGTLTITNNTASVINGPFTIGITQLPAAATLVNSNGTYNNAPYVSLPGTVLSINPGGSQSVTLNVTLAGGGAITYTPFVYAGTFPPGPLSVTCPANTATTGTAYNSSLVGSGGALQYTYSISPGSLPTPLTLNPATGAITGTPSAVGLVNFTANVTDSSGFLPFTASAPCSIDVAQGLLSQTISFNSTAPAGAVFNGPTYTVSATATSSLPVAFSIDPSATSVCSVAGNVVSFIGVGTCVINANQAGNGTYAPAPQVQQSFAVGKANQTITFTSVAPVGASIGGPTYPVTATATSGLAVTFSIDASATSVCSIAGNVVSFLAGGTCVINANQSGNGNYNPAPQAQQSFAVKQAQSITFGSSAPANAKFNGPTYTVSATATSGLPVAFSIDVSAASVCSIAGNVVSFIGVGTCVINANQAGNATFSPAPQVQQSFAVGKADQTITFTSAAPSNATIGGTYPVTATASSGLTVSFTIDASASSICSIAGNTVTFTASGTCVINANQAGNANFNAAPQVQQNVGVGLLSQTITFNSAAPVGATVGGPTYTVSATATSSLTVTFSIDPLASSVCSIAGNVVSFIGAGTCVINANQAGNASYNAAPQVQQSFAVNKQSQTITFNSSAPASATVSGATYAVSATATSGLPVTFSSGSPAVCTVAGSTVSFIAVGTCTVNANQAGNATFNAAPQAQQSFSVGKGNQTITFTSTPPTNATVGGPTYTVGATATSGLTVTFSINAPSASVCSIAGTVVTFTASGSCVINANQAGNANFNAAPQVQQTVSVVQAPAINSPNAVTFRPGLAGQSFNVTTTGFPTVTSITRTGALPSGVNFTDNGNGTATLNGTPAAGTQGVGGSTPYSLVFTATNGVPPDATQNFTLTIACPVITVNNTVISNPTFGVAMSTVTFSQTGGSGTIGWSASGLPPSVSINPTSGAVTGTPSATGTYTATITATDAGGCTGTKIVTIAVLPSVPSQGVTGVGNTQIYVTGVAGAPTTPASVLTATLLTTVQPAGSVSMTALSCSSGGTINSFDANGRFIFTPNLNSTGATCSYTITSNSGATPTATSASNSVAFVLNNKVWYVSHGASAGGDGRSNTPFQDFGAAANQLNCSTTTANGDFIYVGQGTANTTGACALKANQSLIGAGATLTVGGFTLAAGVAANTPTITGTLSASSATGLTVNGVSLSTGSSAAVNLVNSDGSFTFRSISTTGAASGIIWDNTSGSQATGSFTVSSTGAGTCTAANPSGCTGGIIASSTDTGIKLVKVANVSLNRMRVNTSTNFGLNGSSVNTMSISNSVFDGTAGGAVDEGQIFVTNWFGTGTISNTDVANGFNDNIRVDNRVAGTLNRLTVSNSTIRNSGNNHGLAFYTCLNGASGTCTGLGASNLTVTGTTFTDNSSNSVNISLASGGSSDVVLQNNQFLSTSLVTVGGPGASVFLGVDHNSDMTLDVNGNNFQNTRLSALTLFTSNLTTSAASMVGKVRSNTIGTLGTDLSGSRQGSGMQINATGAAVVTLNVTGNTIRNWATNNGMDISAGDGGVTGPQVNLTITGNTVKLDTPTVNQLHGISANLGSTSTGGAVTACVDIGGAGALANTLTNSNSPAGGGADIRFRQRFASNVVMPGLATATAPGAVTFLNGRNTITTVPSTVGASVSVAAPATGTFSGGAACTQAP